MTSPTFADATTAASATDIEQALVAELAAAGSPIAGLPDSSPDRGVLAGEAFYLGYEQLVRAKVAQGCSVTGALAAGDDWVDAAATWYNIPNGTGGTGRIAATFAIWTIGLVCTAPAAPMTLTPQTVLQVQSTAPGAPTFNLSIAQAVTLNSGSSYKAQVQVTARLPGTAAGNVTPGTITAIIAGSSAGLSIDLTVTQVLTRAARDAETSPALVARCLASLTRMGAAWTRQAFDYLIPTSDTDITRWVVDDSNPFGPGSIGVWLATAAGPGSTQDVVTEQTALGASNVRALGSGQLVVQPATARALTINATLRGDGSNAALAANATAALVDPAVGLGTVMVLGPATLTVDLVRSVLMGAAYNAAAGNAVVRIPSGSASVPLTLNLPGFSGVEEIASCDFTSDLVLATGEVLQLTANVSVE